jgi:hypothetical protein
MFITSPQPYEKSWQQAYRIEEGRNETRFIRHLISYEEYEKSLAKAGLKMRGSWSQKV